MKTDIAKSWCEALRSGNYKRGLYQFRDLDDRYDPIGVLCELAAQAGVCTAEKRDKPKATHFFGWLYDGEATRLPKSVGEWSGLEYWAANHIAHRSDHGRKFEETADYIEETYVTKKKQVRGDGKGKAVSPGQDKNNA